MEFERKTLPLDDIIQSGNSMPMPTQSEMEMVNWVARRAEKPLLVYFDGQQHHFSAGVIQLLAKKSVQQRESVCIIVKQQPPPDLVTLMDEYWRKDAHGVVEALCIKRLHFRYHFKLVELAEMVGCVRGTMTDLLAISRLPKKILDDAIADSTVPKNILEQIAQSRVSPSRMIALYQREKKSRQKNGGKAQKISGKKAPGIIEISKALQQALKAAVNFRQHSQQARVRPRRPELRTLSHDLKLVRTEISNLLKLYDASYKSKRNVPDRSVEAISKIP